MRSQSWSTEPAVSARTATQVARQTPQCSGAGPKPSTSRWDVSVSPNPRQPRSLSRNARGASSSATNGSSEGECPATCRRSVWPSHPGFSHGPFGRSASSPHLHLSNVGTWPEAVRRGILRSRHRPSTSFTEHNNGPGCRGDTEQAENGTHIADHFGPRSPDCG